jgi:hypothetical protein
VYLAECGTYAIVDAGFWPCHTSDRVGGFRGLRSFAADTLAMWDPGFGDRDMLLSVVERDGQVRMLSVSNT